MEININPFPKQAELWNLLMDDEHKFILYGGGAGGGKSWGYCEWLLTIAYSCPGSRGFIGRNELTRIMKSTFITFQKVCKYHKIPESDWKLDGKYNVIRFKNGSTIDLIDVAFSPMDAEYQRFGSTEYSHGFGEEIGEWNFAAFDVLKSRIGRHKVFDKDDKDITPKSKFGLSCNPSKGWPYRIFYKPWKENRLPEKYAYIPALYTDNPHTAKDYGEQLAMIADDSMRERLMNGNWEYGDGNGEIMKYNNILDIFNNSLPDHLMNERYLIADIARYGRDSTIINVWYGLTSVKRYRYKKTGTNTIEDEIKRIAREHRVPFNHILIDEDGIGGGVVDHLTGVKGFIAQSVPIITRRALRRQNIPNARNGLMERVNFANLKSQCAFKLAELVENHAIAVEANAIDVVEDKEFNDTDIISEEISVIKQKDFDKEVKLKIVSKDEMKESLGRSPDVADTFIMRMVFELLKDRTGNSSLQETISSETSMYHTARAKQSSVSTLAY